MAKSDTAAPFQVHLCGGPDDDDDEIERSTLTIAQDWRELGSVSSVPGGEPPGVVRGIDVAMLGGIIAAIPVELLTAVAEQLMRWVRTRRGRSVEIVRGDGSSIKISRATAEEQRGLVDAATGGSVEVVRGDGSSIKLSQATAEEQHMLVADWIGGKLEA